MPLYWLAGLRHLARHRWLAALAVLGIALGVAVVIAVDLAGHSARQALLLSLENVAGRATHEISAEPGGVPVALYQRLRRLPHAPPMAPVVEATATLANQPGYSLRLLGVDPLAEGSVRGYLAAGMTSPEVAWTLAMRIDSVVLTAQDAAALGVKAGDTLDLLLPNGRAQVPVGAVLQAAVGGRQLSGLMVMNIVGAQQLLGMDGRLTRIDLVLPDDATAAGELTRLRAQLPPQARIQPSRYRAEAMTGMMHAFDFNISALSLLALLVGMFLIYNTMSFIIVQRRPLLGTLRTLGVTRRQVFISILIEALALGLLGTLIGLALGVGLAQLLLGLVGRTINDLYFNLQVRALDFSVLSFAKGIVLGLAGGVVATAPPAWEAAHTPPRRVLSRSELEARTRRALPWLALIGVAASLAALPLLVGSSRALWTAYLGLVLLVVGIGLWMPGLTLLLMRMLDWLLPRRRAPQLRLAIRAVASSLSRGGVAVAALTIALATTVGMGVMIYSFRLTVTDWLNRALSADVYVSRGAAAPRGAVMPPQILERLRALPDAGTVVAWRTVPVETEYGVLEIGGFDLPPPVQRIMKLQHGDKAQALRALQQPQRRPPVVLISEPLAFHTGLKLGQTLVIRTRLGPVAFAVAGIYQDFGSERGRLMLSTPTYLHYFGETGLTGAGLFLPPGADLQHVLAEVRGLASPQLPLWIASSHEVRDYSITVFDRTFTITAVLRLIALVVSVIGVISALMCLQLERARELAVLRALGMTPGQVGRMVTAQTLLVGAVAGLAALPLGLLLSLVLSLVINRRAFGWTIDIYVDPGLLVQTMFWALLAALLAGLYPAWLMARTPAALALRED